jgi:pilus assembly protein Flp/PilA
MLELIRSITSRRDEDGASAVEYGLLVAGIAALIVAIVFVFGGMISGVFKDTCTSIKSNSAAGTTAAAATCT